MMVERPFEGNRPSVQCSIDLRHAPLTTGFSL